jgi:gluconokinase
MILVIMGVTGAGKSTIGRRLGAELGWTFVDADDFHPRANIEKMRRGEPLDDGDREPWLARLARAVEQWLDQGLDVVLACSALKDAYRRRLMLDPTRMRLVYLTAPPEVLERRLRERTGHFMPAALLRSQFRTLETPTDALVVDVSGAPEQAVAQIRTALAPTLADRAGA